MARNIRVKSGNAHIEASPELNDLVNDLLNKALPETRQAIERALDEVLAQAKREWPIRTTRPTRKQLESGEAFQPKVSSKSQRSIDKFETGLLLEGDAIKGYIRNNAQYAYAILAGPYSFRSDIPVGKRYATELIFKPMIKASDIVIESLARDLMRGIK